MGDREWMHEPSAERTPDRMARSFSKNRWLASDRLFGRVVAIVVLLGIALIVVAIALS